MVTVMHEGYLTAYDIPTLINQMRFQTFQKQDALYIVWPEPKYGTQKT